MTTHIVVSGDTLWSISERYLGSGTRWGEIADLNGIDRERPLIYRGQSINVDVDPASPSKATPIPTYNKLVTLEYYGLQAGTDRTMFVKWYWNKSHTDHYNIRWYYSTVDGWAMIGSDTNVDYYFYGNSYTAPDNAEKVWCCIKPISETYTSNNNQVNYWTADWFGTDEYYFEENPPQKLNAPTVEIDKFNLTVSLDNLDDVVKKVHFQIVKDNSIIFNSGVADVITSHASYLCVLEAGGKYKVRCRGENNGKYGEWSEYSSNYETVPNPPLNISELKSTSETSVHISWDTVDTADSYTVEYTTKIIYFDGSTQVSSITVENSYAEITGIESGQEYFFRVRSNNDQGYSGWTEIKSISIGKKPSAPTTWSSGTSVVVGESLNLYWVHNSQDGSVMRYSELELTIDGVVEPTYIIENEDVTVDIDKVWNYEVDTSLFSEGSNIKWRVRTCGITLVYGDYSVQRSVDIYAPPTLQLGVTDSDDELLDVVTEFPFYINAIPGPRTQAPVSYYVNIVANSTYETIDNIGNIKTISSGDSVYSQFFDTNEHLIVEMSANNIDLENNISYTVICTVSMNSGLTVETSVEFSVSWIGRNYSPSAEISFDKDSLVSYIKPYCEYYEYEYYEVEYNSAFDVYIKTNNRIEETDGLTVNGAVTTTDELVYETSNGDLFCLALPDIGTLAQNVKLSVYRREYDGRFTEIASDLDNLESTFVTDPHPSLDYARYRIIATDSLTGTISYYDVPGYPIQEKSIVIQWDEKWTNFNINENEILVEPPWSGSLLKLPYNIEINDSYNMDSALIEYIGREHPVSYYGTQTGESSSWTFVIDKQDKETLYSLRRLAIWRGDVYVREPSGSGYWANIKISFNQRFKEVTIPVTLNIVRVEGGA